MNQRRIGRDQLSQPIDVAGIQRRQSGGKARVRRELSDLARQLDALFELCP